MHLHLGTDGLPPDDSPTRRLELMFSRLRYIVLVDLLNVLSGLPERSLWCFLAKDLITPMGVGCYCGLPTVEFVIGDGIRVELLLNTSKLPFKVVEDQTQYSDVFHMERNIVLTYLIPSPTKSTCANG